MNTSAGQIQYQVLACHKENIQGVEVNVVDSMIMIGYFFADPIVPGGYVLPAPVVKRAMLEFFSKIATQIELMRKSRNN